MSFRSWRFQAFIEQYGRRNRNSLSTNAIAIVSTELPKVERHTDKHWHLSKATTGGAGGTYFRLLRESSTTNRLQRGKLVHAHMIKTGFEPDTFLFNCLVNMYAKCGNMANACQVFDKMATRDAVSWNSMIAGYLICGHAEEALGLFCEMQREGVSPTQSTFASVLVACADMGVLEYSKEIHTQIMKYGFQVDVCVDNGLVNTYGRCGSIEDASQVFDKMHERDDVSWRVMLTGHLQNGHVENALKLIKQMLMLGVGLDEFNFSGVLSACASLECGKQGRQFHAAIIKVGFESDVSVGNALISMYAKSESMENARQVFDRLDGRDVVSWNTMIAGYAQNGYADGAVKVFSEMQQAGLKSNESTIASFIRSCSGINSLEKAKQVHAQITKIAYDLGFSADNAILSMYVKCGSLDTARNVFEKMPKQNLISWNAMIAGFAQHGYANEALCHFNEMQMEGIQANNVTLSSLLNVCSSPESLEKGKQLHSNVVKAGLDTNILVGNALVAMYAKCKDIEDACRLFIGMTERDVASWNMAIAGYIQNGYYKDALVLFWEMQQSGMILNQFTLANVLSACLVPEDLEKGKQVHAHLIKTGFEFDVALMNALVTMYIKCGSLGEAYELFREMPIRDAISWSTMIAGCARYRFSEAALKLSCQMHLAGMKMNQMTFASVLRACASLAALEQGKQFHALIIKNGSDSDMSVCNAFVTMYAKCASIEDACRVFDKSDKQDVITWNAMIAGLAQHGQGKQAVELFEQMQLTGIKPNHLTYVGILSACSHGGLIEKGHYYFDSMVRDHDIRPREEHYSCMVDLLARAGQLVDAECFINKMPFKPGPLVWRTLLSACRIHGNVELGKRSAECLLKLEPQDTATYVLLSNIYASTGRWDDRAHVRKMMKDRRVNKEPGCSWIQVKNRMHTFLAGDRSHPQTEEIYAELERLNKQLEEVGYGTDRNLILHDITQEPSFHHHSEKLAIAFGLISTISGTPIRIIKNLRVCSDCHTAIKFISMIVSREFVVRDAHRFHHFNNGMCSCGEYW